MLFYLPVLKKFNGSTNPDKIKKTTTQKYPAYKTLNGVSLNQVGGVFRPGYMFPSLKSLNGKYG